jgi:hypothetical protein
MCQSKFHSQAANRAAYKRLSERPRPNKSAVQSPPHGRYREIFLFNQTSTINHQTSK